MFLLSTLCRDVHGVVRQQVPKEKKLKLKRFEYAVATALVVLLAGCGGGGGGGGDSTTPPPTGGTPAPTPTIPTNPPTTPTNPTIPPAADYVLGGTVTGLRAGATVTLATNGQTLPVAANGAFAFPTRLAAGAAFDIQVTAPNGYTCKGTNTAGALDNTNSTKAAVDCAPVVLAGVRGALQAPLAVAGDGSGNLYVTDGSLHGVLKLSSNGQLGMVAGGTGQPGLANGSGSAARFWLNASGAAVDSQGNLFVGDSCNGAIRKMTAAGEVSTLAGSGSTACYNVDSAKTTPTKADGIGAAARFEGPQSIASDGAGGVYVIDRAAGLTIRQATAAGVVTTTTYANPDVVAPVALLQTIARAPDGTLYVSDDTDRIWKVVGNALVLHAGGVLGTTKDGAGVAARFGAITGMVATPNGDLYVTDFASVRKVTPSGVVSTLAGSPAGSQERGDVDGTGTAARFGNLLSIGFDGTSLFVVDSGQEVLRKVTLDGVVTTVAATPAVRKTVNGDAATARFGSFSSLAADADGNMYFADPVTHVVRKATPDGTVTTLAGVVNSAALPNQGDGPLATARFAAPTRVAVGRDGSIWVAQTLGLRRIKDGVVTTVDAAVRPISLAVDPDGNAIVTTGAVSGEVLRITPTGGRTMLATKSQIAALAGAGADPRPQSVAVDAAGNIYFADTGTVAVYKLTKAGALSVFAGTQLKETGNVDGPVGTATLGFYEVDHMTIDEAGNLYLTGSGNVRKISPTGVVSTPTFVWGNASIGAITYNKGKLVGMTRYAVLQQYL